MRSLEVSTGVRKSQNESRNMIRSLHASIGVIRSLADLQKEEIGLRTENRVGGGRGGYGWMGVESGGIRRN